MFAFENWHSALEMKLYHPALHPPHRRPAGLQGPALHPLQPVRVHDPAHGEVSGRAGRAVPLRRAGGQREVRLQQAGSQGGHRASKSCGTARKTAIALTENDLVFITNGGCVENSSMGSQNEPAAYNTELKPGGGWDMWRKIAAQDPSFGHPDKFCQRPRADQLDERHRGNAGSAHHPLHQEHLQARSLHRQGRHRRHRHREGFRLADELDHQPSASVPGAAQGSLPGVGVQPVHRQARRLCQKAHAGMHR